MTPKKSIPSSKFDSKYLQGSLIKGWTSERRLVGPCRAISSIGTPQFFRRKFKILLLTILLKLGCVTHFLKNKCLMTVSVSWYRMRWGRMCIRRVGIFQIRVLIVCIFLINTLCLQLWEAALRLNIHWHCGIMRVIMFDNSEFLI